ncbi:protein DMR6-LIKE OXYGENASE 2-like [Quercus robur]|uniref:protein DMR6-LIKE OXYGENASE 2-like n=1 Tax=Quercus robur TaxID=38942 RepID=UPI00216362E8|nr:protein DMR6-LIKE OXYGENASE 2-like [Quercus robur]
MEMTPYQLANNTPLTLSPNFILPEDKRPNLLEVLPSATIPIIDLNDHDTDDGQGPSPLVSKISQACEEYGFFHIINHGVPKELCQKVMAVVTEFFQLPPEVRAQYLTEDHTQQVKVFNYYQKYEGIGKVAMWSETFSHPWHPTEDFTNLLPANPPQYREVFSEYAREIGALMDRLLSLISRGLGLDKECLKKRMGERPGLNCQANYYPPCPKPELTMGLPDHNDLGSIAVLLQVEGVTGLQMIKDGKWLSINPVPNAFVVNLADQIQVLSNGKFKSVGHRAVTNKLLPRLSLGMFYTPSRDTMIGPIEDLIDEEHSPKYRNYSFKDYMDEFYRQEGKRRRVKEAFEFQL